MHRLKLDSLQLFRDCPGLHSYGVNDYLVPLRSIEYNALPTVSTLRHITRGTISLFRGRSMRDFENITHLDMRDQDYNRDAAETAIPCNQLKLRTIGLSGHLVQRFRAFCG